MLIRLNGQPRPIPDHLPLVRLIDEVVGPENCMGVAVALNDEIVRRAEWESVTLGEGDAIEIVRATQGG